MKKIILMPFLLSAIAEGMQQLNIQNVHGDIKELKDIIGPLQQQAEAGMQEIDASITDFKEKLTRFQNLVDQQGLLIKEDDPQRTDFNAVQTQYYEVEDAQDVINKKQSTLAALTKNQKSVADMNKIESQLVALKGLIEKQAESFEALEKKMSRLDKGMGPKFDGLMKTIEEDVVRMLADSAAIKTQSAAQNAKITPETKEEIKKLNQQLQTGAKEVEARMPGIATTYNTLVQDKHAGKKKGSELHVAMAELQSKIKEQQGLIKDVQKILGLFNQAPEQKDMQEQLQKIREAVKDFDSRIEKQKQEIKMLKGFVKKDSPDFTSLKEVEEGAYKKAVDAELALSTDLAAIENMLKTQKNAADAKAVKEKMTALETSKETQKDTIETLERDMKDLSAKSGAGIEVMRKNLDVDVPSLKTRVEAFNASYKVQEDRIPQNPSQEIEALRSKIDGDNAAISIALDEVTADYANVQLDTSNTAKPEEEKRSNLNALRVKVDHATKLLTDAEKDLTELTPKLDGSDPVKQWPIMKSRIDSINTERETMQSALDEKKKTIGYQKTLLPTVQAIEKKLADAKKDYDALKKLYDGIDAVASDPKKLLEKKKDIATFDSQSTALIGKEGEAQGSHSLARIKEDLAKLDESISTEFPDGIPVAEPTAAMQALLDDPIEKCIAADIPHARERFKDNERDGDKNPVVQKIQEGLTLIESTMKWVKDQFNYYGGGLEKEKAVQTEMQQKVDAADDMAEKLDHGLWDEMKKWDEDNKFERGNRKKTAQNVEDARRKVIAVKKALPAIFGGQ